MKITIVTRHATAAADDAAAVGLTRALAQQGHQVTVVTDGRGGEKAEIATSAGVRVVRIAGGPEGTDPLTRVPELSEPLRTRLSRERPDVVHALDWTSGLAALSATRDLGLPVVQTFSSLGIAEAAPAPARLRLEPAIGRSAQAVVGTSAAVVTNLARIGVPRKLVRCIPWGVDTDVFTPDGPAVRRTGKPRLLALASLAEREPLETLIWAMARVPDAELLISGGPARPELPHDPAYRDLVALAGSIGLADRVVFTGEVPRPALPALLRSADLVLTACADEPSGLASLEAMACGKAVLASRSGRHSDAVVDGTTGLLIPPGRPMLLAQLIRRLLARPMLLEAYGVAGADRARSRYSWDRIASETVAVYEQAQLAA